MHIQLTLYTNHDMQILLCWSCCLKALLIVSRAFVLDLGSGHIEDARITNGPVAVNHIVIVPISQGCKRETLR